MEEKIVPIPDAECEHFGVRATWGIGNQLFAFAGHGKPKDGVSDVQLEPRIHEVRWDTDMYGEYSRKLVNETQGIFVKLQEVGNSNETKKNAQLVQFSREYRSVIKACAMELQGALDEENNQDPQHQKQVAQLEMLEIMELVWNLCEVLLVDTAPGGVVLGQLLSWLQIHFRTGDIIVRECMTLDRPQDHQDYWNAVYIYTLQGRIDEVTQLLCLHSDAQSPHFSLLCQLLHKMPVFTSSSGQSVGEFELRWRHWQNECIQVLEQRRLEPVHELHNICRILSGEDEVFVELKDHLGTWYCLLISRLFYQQPTVKVFDLQYYTQFCIDAFGGHSTMHPYDNMILAALEYDIHQVIRESSEGFSNWWFAAHLTDLMYHCGKLDAQTLSYGSNLREFLLLEYATSLMSHDSLWQTGVVYLDQCPYYGRYYLEHYLERIPLNTERKARKVLHICEKRDMVDTARGICKVMGMAALQNNRLGTALGWGIRSKDVAFATLLAERFLDEYTKSGDFTNLDLIDNLGSSMLLSGQLTFLGKYREFHRMYAEREFESAGTLLLSLLTARVAPRRFWMTLLLDALPLLEAKKTIFSTTQTYELMHCLEELTFHEGEKNKPAVQSEVEQEKVGLMRLALTRNLARATVEEGGGTPEVG